MKQYPQRSIDVVVFTILNDYEQEQAGAALSITKSTVNSHFIKVRLYAKVKTTGALALWLVKHGHISNE